MCLFNVHHCRLDCTALCRPLCRFPLNLPGLYKPKWRDIMYTIYFYIILTGLVVTVPHLIDELLTQIYKKIDELLTQIYKKNFLINHLLSGAGDDTFW